MIIQETKEIKLSQNKITLVDIDVYTELNQFKWCACESGNTFYAGRQTKYNSNGKRTFIRMHHCILGFPTTDEEVDHIDGNGLNNRIINLRFVTKRQQCQNRKHLNKSSKYPGVYWSKCAKKWIAQITIKGKWKYLGMYLKEVNAFLAYKKANKLLNMKVIDL